MKNSVFLNLGICFILSTLGGYTSVIAGPGNGNSHAAAVSQGSDNSSHASPQASQQSGNTNSQNQNENTQNNNNRVPENQTIQQSQTISIPKIPLVIQDSLVQEPPSRILVRYMDGATDDLKNSLSKQIGLNKIKQMKNNSWVLYETPKNKKSGEVLAKILEKRGILIDNAEIDQLVTFYSVPNDPYFTHQWHHINIGSTKAWDIQPNSSVIVAVADTGVDRSHPDLQNGTLLTGFNTVKNNTDDSDTVGHGTGVIGSIAAVGGNSLGVVGTAFQSKILPIKITSDGSSSAYLSDIGEAIYYARDAGAKVINISFGPLCGSSYFDESAAYMKKNGGLVVVAAGNDGTRSSCAGSTNVIYVSATDNNNIKTSWSTYGSFVDIAAPGESILTTAVGGGYAYVSGTSFSAPIVSGVLALLWSKNVLLDNDTIESIVKKTAHDLGDTGSDMLYGAGLIDSNSALNYLAETPDTPIDNPTPDPELDTQAPIFTSTYPTDGVLLKPRGTLTISASTIDNEATTEIFITFDGMAIAKCTYSLLCKSLPFNLRKIPQGSHTIIYRASDAAGNVTTKIITVSKE